MFFSNDYTFLKKTYGIENGNADNVNKNDKRILTLVEQKYKINDNIKNINIFGNLFQNGSIINPENFWDMICTASKKIYNEELFISEIEYDGRRHDLGLLNDKPIINQESSNSIIYVGKLLKSTNYKPGENFGETVTNLFNPTNDIGEEIYQFLNTSKELVGLKAEVSVEGQAKVIIPPPPPVSSSNVPPPPTNPPPIEEEYKEEEYIDQIGAGPGDAIEESEEEQEDRENEEKERNEKIKMFLNEYENVYFTNDGRFVSSKGIECDMMALNALVDEEHKELNEKYDHLMIFLFAKRGVHIPGMGGKRKRTRKRKNKKRNQSRKK